MDIDLIFKIAAIGIIVSILNQVLARSGRDEQATMTTLAGLVVVLMMIAQKIADLFDLIGWHVEHHASPDCRFQTVEEAEGWIIDRIDRGIPIMVD